MYHHIRLGSHPAERKRNLHALIHSGAITLGGYKKNKIYGLLNCASGKRIKEANRVFFKDEAEAKKYGYRPCGRCLSQKYKCWKEEKLRGSSYKT